MKVAIIGVGSIGQRYLESLLAVDRGYDIYCVEPNAAIIEKLRETCGNRIRTCADVSELPEEMDLCAIPTTSDVRRGVFDALTERTRVKNIIFEKVLFQTVGDYEHVLGRLEALGIRAWVNCWRRDSDAYIALKQKLSAAQRFTFSAVGSEWGLGCNGIHYIDLVRFLADDAPLVLDLSLLRPPVVKAKRERFLEFYGTICGSTGRCESFQISCFPDKDAQPFVISIQSDVGSFVIDEMRGEMLTREKAFNWSWETDGFPLPYVSQLMGGVIDQILESGTCALPTYQTSMESHLPYIKGVREFLRKEIAWEEERCPIT